MPEFQSSLRDEFPILLVYPALEALGYFRGSLRDPRTTAQVDSHQTKAGRRRAHATGLREFAADAGGLVRTDCLWANVLTPDCVGSSRVVSGDELMLALPGGEGWFAMFDFFDFERLEVQVVRR